MTTNTDRLDFYTHVLEPRLQNSATFLGNIDFPNDFKATARGPNQIFVDPTTNAEKTFLIFGEIATAERGTKLGAIGNHYQGPMKYDNTVCLRRATPPFIHRSQYPISPFLSKTNQLQKTYLSFASHTTLPMTSQLYLKIKQSHSTK